MTGKLGVGVIGCRSVERIGGPGAGYAGPHSTLAAVCDLNAEVRRACQRELPELTVYGDYEEMLRDPAVDLVVVNTPNVCHPDMTVAALAAGKHVFCEKPMALNREDGLRMLAAEKASGKRLGIDFELRYSYQTGRRVKEILDAGEIGEVRQLNLHHTRGGWTAEGAGLWRIRRETCGGLILMDLCHMIDLFRYFAGEVTEVQAFAAPRIIPQYDFTDNATVMLFFESGALGILTETHAASTWNLEMDQWEAEGHEDVFFVAGTRGTLRVDAWRKRLSVLQLREYPAGTDAARLELLRHEDHSDKEMHELSHDTPGFRLDFIRRIAQGEPPMMTAADSWRTHEVCFAAEESLANSSSRIRL